MASDGSAPRGRTQEATRGKEVSSVGGNRGMGLLRLLSGLQPQLDRASAGRCAQTEMCNGCEKRVYQRKS
jgi:hypothetical protein